MSLCCRSSRTYWIGRSLGSICAIALVAAMASPLDAISIRHDRPVSSYNALGANHPAAGYLAHTVFGQFCSGVLVAPNKVLTAAHCVQGTSPAVLNFGVTPNVPSVRPNNVQSIDIHPNWNGQSRFDLAVLTLSTPITNVTPASFYDGDPRGLLGTMVGYGNQGDGLSFPNNLPGANHKLGAQNMIDVWFETGDIRTDFDHPNGTTNSFGSAFPVNLEGTTAGGDSGGPLFAEFSHGTWLVGILHGGFNPFGPDSRYGDISIWAQLSSPENLAFLASHGIVPVPEPTAMLPLLALGLAVMAGRRRRTTAS